MSKKKHYRKMDENITTMEERMTMSEDPDRRRNDTKASVLEGKKSQEDQEPEKSRGAWIQKKDSINRDLDTSNVIHTRTTTYHLDRSK